MDTVQLIIVTPRRLALQTAARWVELPAAAGQMQVLPGHAPLLGALGSGLVRYQDAAGADQRLLVNGGFLEVAEGKLTLLADTAEFPAEIPRAQAVAEWERLQRTPPPVADADGADQELRQRNLAQVRAEIAAG